MAIRGLVRSGLVDLEKSKLVGVSLCGGAGAQYENSNTSLYALSLRCIVVLLSTSKLSRTALSYWLNFLSSTNRMCH